MKRMIDAIELLILNDNVSSVEYAWASNKVSFNFVGEKVKAIALTNIGPCLTKDPETRTCIARLLRKMIEALVSRTLCMMSWSCAFRTIADFFIQKTAGKGESVRPKPWVSSQINDK